MQIGGAASPVALRSDASLPGSSGCGRLSTLAVQIFGSPDIKKAIACLLFGGARKRMPDGTYRRGDINVLLLGASVGVTWLLLGGCLVPGGPS